MIARRLAATVALVTVGLTVPVAPARAEDPEPFARSAATTYQVTLAARGCGSYAEVVANQVREDRGESPGRPGRDSPYKPGDPVDPLVEDQSGCEPLAGITFTFGGGREKKGAMSSVTAAGAPVTTLAETPLLDAVGRTGTGQLGGAVTVPLSETQMNLAGKRELWVQGGTPAAPVPNGFQFAVLRCAIDGRTGGNAQWIGYLPGTRHVFCFAYYVRNAAPTGTLAVKLRTTKAVGYAQRVPFTSNLSQSGSFQLTTDSSSASFVRLSGQTYRFRPVLPPGWRLADVSCSASRQVVDVGTGQADITLIGGENASCSYAVTPPAAPPGLTIRALSEGGGGTFGIVVASAATTSSSPSAGTGGTGGGSAPGLRVVSATPTGDGNAAVATGSDLGSLPAGQYRLTVNPPAAETDLWTVGAATCNGSPVTVQGRAVQVAVGSGVVTDCVLRLVRKQGSAGLRVITQGAVATAGFALLPLSTAEPGWSASATTTRAGDAAAASGDLPGSLPFGTYLVIPVAPLTTVDSAWRLTSLGCSPGTSGGPDTRALTIDVRAATPTVDCTATYEPVRAAELRINMQVEGSATAAAPIVVDVSCTDGSTGRLVLAAGDQSSADLPAPLIFTADTNCTVGLGEDTERPFNASLVNEAAAGNAPLALPATVAVRPPDADSSADPAAGDIRLAVTLGYTAMGGRGTDKAKPGVVDSFALLPVALIGAGLIGIGAAVLLVMVARRRLGLADDDDL
ncbi:hypothetical protein [Virgisporangium aurantiacum]|uniref:Uncharacterized protein n=1 Tax=Virgisporangium aurantiacum TaxID=175570 RepID=A0A8J3YZI2_9ACTN|nr:hypothetical protein [Virgisporangium aurantiacum]GIJ53553.1 hypothetical protein Vau01_010690 [Virgisporangium aurantiacum]